MLSTIFQCHLWVREKVKIKIYIHYSCTVMHYLDQILKIKKTVSKWNENLWIIVRK